MMSDGKHYQAYPDPKIFYGHHQRDVNKDAKRGSLINEPARGCAVNCCIVYVSPILEGTFRRQAFDCHCDFG